MMALRLIALALLLPWCCPAALLRHHPAPLTSLPQPPLPADGCTGRSGRVRRDAAIGRRPTGPGLGTFRVALCAPGTADTVLTFRNIHNRIALGRFDAALRAFFLVLKPGGVLGVQEHRTAPGKGLGRIIDSGYGPEACVIAPARTAGFVLRNAQAWLHAAPVLPAHLEQCIRDLPQAAAAHGVHQHFKHIAVVDDGLLQALQQDR